MPSWRVCARTSERLERPRTLGVQLVDDLLRHAAGPGKARTTLCRRCRVPCSANVGYPDIGKAPARNSARAHARVPAFIWPDAVLSVVDTAVIWRP